MLFEKKIQEHVNSQIQELQQDLIDQKSELTKQVKYFEEKLGET